MEWFPLFVTTFLHHLIFLAIAKIIFAVKAGRFWEWLAQRLYSVPICAHHYIHQTTAGVFLSLNVKTQTFYLDRVLQTHTSYLEYLKFYGSYQNICAKKEKISDCGINKRRDQLNATNGDLLVINFSSTRFGCLYAHHQEVILYFTAHGFLFLSGFCLTQSSNILFTVHTSRHPTLQHHNRYDRTESHRLWNTVWPPDDGRKDARKYWGTTDYQ
jgi:hypothetical protein